LACLSTCVAVSMWTHFQGCNGQFQGFKGATAGACFTVPHELQLHDRFSLALSELSYHM